MSVWPGLGVNYNGTSISSGHIPYFLANDLNYIRPFIPASVYPYNSSTNQTYRNIANTFLNNGFYVTWGVTHYINLTTSNWSNYHDSVIAEASYLQSQNIILSDFEIGNELELACTPTISILTQMLGTAIAITSVAHGFSNGESVTIYGATPSGYNGTFAITVTSSTMFTYSVSSSLTSPATGSIACYSLAVAILRNNIRQLAVDVKAVYSGAVSYAAECEGSSQNGALHGSSGFIADGTIGSLDFLSIHPYGDYSTPGGVPTISLTNAENFITNAYNAFGSQIYISEFNLNGSASNLSKLSQSYASTMMATYLNFIQNSNVSIAMAYLWQAGSIAAGTPSLAVGLNYNNSMNPMWFTFFESNPIEYSIGARATETRTSVNRTSVSRSTVTRPLFNSS